jgi:hypothetical protein
MFYFTHVAELTERALEIDEFSALGAYPNIFVSARR